eukprot:CAMPEP_0174750968 /NCGR_PEP_ID=MMETSP1094-20130205/98895_1 /TAXON_ID=156173 /ORGANISM="Chrysochromulina brevifilum, Strain UTEX LB 985" /LENGTH=94 /DNA_ID=CAMNT_0015956389 /DNA_START=81 /DNA_END=362 /DNA_ORIENTATION=+
MSLVSNRDFDGNPLLPPIIVGRLSFDCMPYRGPRSSATSFTSCLLSLPSSSMSPNVVLASQNASTKKDDTSFREATSAASKLNPLTGDATAIVG